MRIFQLNCVYGNGSTGKLVESNSRILRSMGHEVLTCYGNPPDMDDGSSKRITSTFEHKFNSLWSRLNGIPFGGLFLSNARVLKEITRFKPNVVHVHCVNGQMINIYHLLRDLGEMNIKTVVTLHAEFFHTGSCAHACECDQWKTECLKCDKYKYETSSWFFNRVNRAWKLMYDAFASFRPENIVITAVSSWLAERASQSAILNKFRVKYVPNGVNTDIFRLSEPITIDCFKNAAKTILFVTPYFSLETGHLKGGYFLPGIANKLPEYNFLVVASRSSEIDNTILPPNLKIWGKAKEQSELARLYSSADLTLLLSQRETFSMVTAESLCCGTPVVGFKAGGPESITLNEYSEFVTYGDISQLISKLKEWMPKTYDSRVISANACRKYSEIHMSKLYLSIYNSFFK